VRDLGSESPAGLPVQQRLRDDWQRLEATNDRCGPPLQFASGTGEPQLGQAPQQATERDLGLHPRQVRADAKVNAISKRKMRIGLAGYVQPIGFREFLRIPVGGGNDGENNVAAPDPSAVQVDVPGRISLRCGLNGRREA